MGGGLHMGDLLMERIKICKEYRTQKTLHHWTFDSTAQKNLKLLLVCTEHCEYIQISAHLETALKWSRSRFLKLCLLELCINNEELALKWQLSYKYFSVPIYLWSHYQKFKWNHDIYSGTKKSSRSAYSRISVYVIHLKVDWFAYLLDALSCCTFVSAEKLFRTVLKLARTWRVKQKTWPVFKIHVYCLTKR